MNLAPLIDHTLLRSDADMQAIERLCQEAIEHQFCAVCVPPYFVGQAARLLERKAVKIATVIGFPQGYTATPGKVAEIKRAIDDGVDELDAVINICAVKSGQWNYVRNDIDSMTRVAHLKNKRIKIILETDLLTVEEIQQLCAICTDNAVNFVKTSTGFRAGATPEIVQLLRSHLPESIKIKASGGIRTAEFAQQLIEAGAQRLGTSSGLQLIG
jgi:deoxyribose-phosphate aldolase